jgi:hypothetical protein
VFVAVRGISINVDDLTLTPNGLDALVKGFASACTLTLPSVQIDTSMLQVRLVNKSRIDPTTTATNKRLSVNSVSPFADLPVQAQVLDATTYLALFIIIMLPIKP